MKMFTCQMNMMNNTIVSTYIIELSCFHFKVIIPLSNNTIGIFLYLFIKFYTQCYRYKKFIICVYFPHFATVINHCL